MPATSTPITSRHNAVVARYRAVARGDTDGLLLLDGAHLIEEAIRADIVIEHTAVAVNMSSDEIPRLVASLRSHGVETVSVTAPVMDALSPVRSPSAIVAIARRPQRNADDIYRGPLALAVVACDVQDPGNLGAIVRVAEAGGASGVVAAGASADPFGWKALRGSMGSALRLPIQRVDDVATALADARRHGCRIVATVPRDGKSLYEANLKGPSAILVGGEGPGLSGSAIAAADERVTIPMQTPVESLNAAVTAALVVYEARRQRP